MWRCDTCNRRFQTESDCVDHMDHYEHWGERFPCETCSLEFLTEEAADFHMLLKRHYKGYCYDCDRVFSNENALRGHLRSSIHQQDNIFCPFCRQGYVTPSGVCNHLESGSCFKASNLNHEEVHKLIQRADPDGRITNRQGESHSGAQEPEQVIERPRRAKHWCNQCQRVFVHGDALRQHLNSPAHKKKIYHCPNKEDCDKDFTSLAGLCGHLESESCGFMKFGQVRKMQKQLSRALKGEGTIKF